ncbi:hypothetical protein [Aminicella lysinilytica]|uniref:hypothetical protein n=1 Tax=Aminicella lysinilytica TaxID=433323 RepID=UPI0026F1AD62|nr:hypothetical protein [Aminicella lysinilytica]
MKNLITSMACIAILLAFVLQFTQNQVVYNHIVSIDQAVNTFKEVVKQEGSITAVNEAALKGKISHSTGCGSGEITVAGTRSKVMRGNRIHYRVEVPIKGIIGAAGFWKISRKDNRINYVIDRYTTSEYIGRKGG